MAQVKFYSVSSLPNEANAGGVYFVDGGELYKGTQRFGANKVFTKGEDQDLASFASVGQIGGDILVGIGAAKVWDPATGMNGSWVDLGADNTALQSAWRSDISTWTAGLVQSGEGSYITGITQDADGKVTASASNFATDVKTAIGNGSASGSGNGITVSVVTTSGSVTGVEVSASQISCDTVTANTGNFTNLNVSDTASFAATTVAADSLTIGGSTVEQLADKQIAAIAESYAVGTSNGVTVSVTTSGGNVTGVAVNAGAFGNVMHFVDVVTELPSESNVAGDIVIVGANPTGTGLVAGQEYIYDGDNWELIGDQNTYALNSYTHGEEVVTANASTLPDAIHALATAVDALNTKTSAYVGGTSTSADQGVSVTVAIDASTMAPTVTTAVTSATLFAGLDASVTSSENNSIKVGVTEVDGVVTGVTADLLWLGADGTALA